jgi:uroporphyrinogen-III synthase
MHILLTRPLEDSTEMILKFKSLGHQVSHLPLLKIEKVNYNEINFSDLEGSFLPVLMLSNF